MIDFPEKRIILGCIIKGRGSIGMKVKIFLENFYVHALVPPERSVNMGFPLKEIGYLDSVKVSKDLVYSDFLEFTLRLSSQDEFSTDILDGREYRTPFPHVIIKKPGVHHAYTTESPRSAFFLQYHPDIYPKLEQAGFCFEPLIRPVVLTDSLLEKIHQMLDLAPLLHLPMFCEKADILAWSLLLELFAEPVRRQVEDKTFQKIQEAAIYLQNHCLEITRISDLAKRFGFSERSLLRHWKGYYGCTPVQTLLKYRLEYACSCLRYTDMPISSIASALQCSPIYFDRFFHRSTGMTPLKYRKMHG